MGAPAAAIGDPADLLHVKVHHVTGPACIDLPGLAVALSAGVDEPPSAETELGQVAGDGAAVDRESELDEVVGGSIGRPFVFTPPGLDALGDPGGGTVRTPMPRRRAALQTVVAVTRSPVDPLRRARPRDSHLGRHMGDRPGLASLNQPAAAFDTQWRVGVSHNALLVVLAGCGSPRWAGIAAAVAITARSATDMKTKAALSVPAIAAAAVAAARPIAPPNCFAVFIRPEAAPACSGRTPVVTSVASGVFIRPPPIPIMTVGTRTATAKDAPSTTVSQSSPGTATTTPATISARGARRFIRRGVHQRFTTSMLAVRGRKIGRASWR